MKTYLTAMINKSSWPVPVFDGPHLLFEIQPGEEKCVEALDPINAYYARYSKVTWTDKGVDLEIRKDWKEPSRGKWTLWVKNIDGAVLETRRFGKVIHYFPRDIPVEVELQVLDEQAPYKSMEIVSEEKLVPDPRRPGYLDLIRKVEDKYTPRDLEEMNQLNAGLDLALEELKANPPNEVKEVGRVLGGVRDVGGVGPEPGGSLGSQGRVETLAGSGEWGDLTPGAVYHPKEG